MKGPAWFDKADQRKKGSFVTPNKMMIGDYVETQIAFPCCCQGLFLVLQNDSRIHST